MSKQDDLLDTVQEAYKLLCEAKMDFHESVAKVHRLAARNLLLNVTEWIDRDGTLKEGPIK